MIDCMDIDDMNREEFGLSEGYKMPKTIYADILNVDKIFTDGTYLLDKFFIVESVK